MIAYRYRARTADGTLVAGSLRAPGIDAAAAALHERALFVVSVAPPRAPLLDALHRGGSARTRVALFRCLATLISAGVPLRRALGVTIERCAERRLRSTLSEVAADVERGEALSVALGRRPKHFAPLVVAMIAAGEAGGLLDEVLERIAQFLERDHDLLKRVIAALAYPAAVLAVSLAMTTFLLVRVVPMFADMFASFHVDLPPATRLLLAAGALLDRPPAWLAAAVAVVTTTGLFRALRRTAAGRAALDRACLRPPPVGRLTRTRIEARLGRMRVTVVRAGVEPTSWLLYT